MFPAEYAMPPAEPAQFREAGWSRCIFGLASAGRDVVLPELDRIVAPRGQLG